MDNLANHFTNNFLVYLAIMVPFIVGILLLERREKQQRAQASRQ